MERGVVFLNQIKMLSRNIENHPEQAINELTACLSENPAFIIDNPATINMLNALTAVIEEGTTPAALFSLKEALWHYWLMLFRMKKMDIFFIGNQQHAEAFYQHLPKNVIENFYFIKCSSDQPLAADAFRVQLNRSERPVMIYDSEAENCLSLPEVNEALGIAAFQEVMVNKAAPFSLEADTFIAYMQEKHQRIISQEVATLIVGNSYCYHAFPQQDLHQAVNLAMHSMDLKQAHAMVHHYTEKAGVKEIVMMFGLFDLFYELAKTRAEENIRVVHILSHYNHHNQIIPHAKSSLPIFDRTEAERVAEMIPFNSTTPAIQSLYQKLDNAEVLASHRDFWETKKQDTAFLDKVASQESSIMRAALHSKSVKYRQSLQNNKRWLREIAALMQHRGVTLHYVIPPFPAAYRQHMHPEMVRENGDFLRSLCSDNFVLHDLSAHQDFSRTDFLDGDHINYTGAGKIIRLLKKAGVAL